MNGEVDLATLQTRVEPELLELLEAHRAKTKRSRAYELREALIERLGLDPKTLKPLEHPDRSELKTGAA
jgi:hypothetical protein